MTDPAVTDISAAERPMSGTTAPPFLEVRDLHVSYGDTPALVGLDCTIAAGEFVAVLGPSGCGKSTLLQVLSGLMTPRSGSIRVDGVEVLTESGARPRLGYVFQDHRLLPWRTVAQNIELVLDAAGVPSHERAARIDRYLAMLEISRFRDSWPLRMSGGQRQRASIARALAIEPVAVLMDEPFSTLDEVTGRTMRAELLKVWEESGRTFVFVTHSIREALYLADRILILSRGPASLVEDFTVPLARPRRYEDAALSDLEGEIIDRVTAAWGLDGVDRP